MQIRQPTVCRSQVRSTGSRWTEGSDRFNRISLSSSDENKVSEYLKAPKLASPETQRASKTQQQDAQRSSRSYQFNALAYRAIMIMLTFGCMACSPHQILTFSHTNSMWQLGQQLHQSTPYFELCSLCCQIRRAEETLFNDTYMYYLGRGAGQH